MEIRNISIGYAKRKRRKQKENEINIRQRYSELFEILQTENNVMVQNEFELVKKELENCEIQKGKEAIFIQRLNGRRKEKSVHITFCH